MKPPVEAQALIRGDLIVSLDYALRGLAMLLIHDPSINYGPADQRAAAGTNVGYSRNAGDLSREDV
jgi:hypothetical protein